MKTFNRIWNIVLIISVIFGIYFIGSFAEVVIKNLDRLPVSTYNFFKVFF